MNAPLTAAAARVLQLANKLAQADKSGESRPEQLLYALSQHESRATVILQSYGIDAELTANHFQSLPRDVENDCEEASISRSSVGQFAESCRQALNLMKQDANSVEVGSEHLLGALVTFASPVAEFLSEHGLTTIALAKHLPDLFPAPPDPLAVDFEIQWESQKNHAQNDAFRVIDAAANRAREGLRVVEDFVRFVLDDGHLTAQLKELRHGLTASLNQLSNQQLLASRETETDVGTEISTRAEQERASSSALVAANFKRLQEALRTLEEFGKLRNAELGRQMEELRYRSYTLEKAVMQTLSSQVRLDDCRLYFLVSSELCQGDVEAVVRQAILGGVRVVQLREKTLTDREIIILGKRLRKITRELGALFIMNDRADLAVVTRADGVHVGQEELTVREARRVVGPECLVGVSTHNLEQARQAVLDGADYLGVGPIFSSQTKSFDELAGLEFARQVAKEVTLPWFAIGGIDQENVGNLLDAGASRVAVSGAICRAKNPQTVARELRERLKARK